LHQYEDKLLSCWQTISDAGVLLGVSVSKVPLAFHENTRGAVNKIRTIIALNGVGDGEGLIVKTF
jgi:hypothetical protein